MFRWDRVLGARLGGCGWTAKSASGREGRKGNFKKPAIALDKKARPLARPGFCQDAMLGLEDELRAELKDSWVMRGTDERKHVARE